jgi:hypothetical protein
MLFVAVPILVFAGLLLVANRRASRLEQQRRRHLDHHDPQDQQQPRASGEAPMGDTRLPPGRPPAR